jgi:hypothetical protein
LIQWEFLSLRFSCSFCFGLEFFLALLFLLVGLPLFMLLMALGFFFIIDDLLELFFGFWSSSYAS